ncbi:MAG: GxxExxY protein [Verrucomicrobiota bacterium]
MDVDLIEKELTGKIIGAAMTVLQELKPGLDEKLYEKALVIELQRLGIKTDQQKQFPVHYRNEHIGTLIPDLVVENKVIIETKVAENLNRAHEAQLLGYLTITGMRIGLLLNFKDVKLRWKRLAK